METYFLSNEDILKFYDRIVKDYQLYVPVKTKTPIKIACDYGFSLPTDDYILKEYSAVNKEEIVFNEYRPIEPVRTFFNQYKEEVGEYFAQETIEKDKKEKPVAISGIKNCDIFSLKIQDFVFLGKDDDIVDPFYKKRRQDALIISGDCPGFKEACFCRAFDINPYCEQGFDFNLSVLNNGYLVDVNSKKANLIAGSIRDLLTPATLGQLSGRSAKRDAVIRKLDEHLSHHKIPKKEVLQEIVKAGHNSQIWHEQMRTCVECGGCIFMCDTCHCFLLSDEISGNNSKRLRVWDGCLLKNFTRVAGGGNALKMRYMRLRNRYIKKFDFFIDNIGFQACCGCGRCIDVCPGRIDIRNILRRLYDEKYLPAS